PTRDRFEHTARITVGEDSLSHRVNLPCVTVGDGDESCCSLLLLPLDRCGLRGDVAGCGQMLGRVDDRVRTDPQHLRVCCGTKIEHGPVWLRVVLPVPESCRRVENATRPGARKLGARMVD